MANDSLYELALSEKFRPVLEQVKAFIANEVQPLEQEYYDSPHEDEWQFSDRQMEILRSLQHKAREQNLWNFFLPNWNGSGITNLDYAYLCEQMGRSYLYSEVFNCAAPDTGNMEVLEKYGSEAQKERWLRPLLASEIRSAYAMTEPGVSSSDAKNIRTTAVLTSGEWVINGEKFYISGAGSPLCKVMIVMVVTDPKAPRSSRHSQILVPTDAPGVQILEGMQVFGRTHAPKGHMHIKFDNARVPEDHIILGPGRGFEISQGRLGPGRIHHCMRQLGRAEHALDLLMKRGLERTAFGKPLLKLGGNYDIVARARIDIDAARLMVLRAARAMDVLSNDEARVHISMVKAMVPEITCRVIDQAIQLHGAAGVSQSTPLAEMYADARHVRFADGPDEVHRMVVARAEVAKHAAP